MKIFYLAVLLPLLSIGCATQQGNSTLTQARSGFQTTLVSSPTSGQAAEKAPQAVFRTLKYPAASGELTAYVSPDPRDGKKHPAIVWITGGDCNSIGDVWTPNSSSNDQSASAYRKAGIVMMFPSLRGGNDNPGKKEGFLGEVDDVIAATEFLKKQSYVDPNRIYLGGHSTGGTLALLVAESSPIYRAIFAFGPVDDVAGYGKESGFLPFDVTNEKEIEVRSPGYWLGSIQSPTWVLEGKNGGNLDSLELMAKGSTNSKVTFIAVNKADHFSILAPANQLIAQKILADTGSTTNLQLSEDEVNRVFG
jgi:dipeptidyl aminopeptidase/acylaminoacyl peptidase